MLGIDTGCIISIIRIVKQSDEEKVTIELSVFDEMLTVTVNKKEQKLYEDAAHFITKRYSWYYKLMKRLRVSQRSQGWL